MGEKSLSANEDKLLALEEEMEKVTDGIVNQMFGQLVLNNGLEVASWALLSVKSMFNDPSSDLNLEKFCSRAHSILNEVISGGTLDSHEEKRLTARMESSTKDGINHLLPANTPILQLPA